MFNLTYDMFCNGVLEAASLPYTYYTNVAVRLSLPRPVAVLLSYWLALWLNSIHQGYDQDPYDRREHSIPGGMLQKH